MILSASRRTDLPALYTPWFLERVRQGWCAVPNPFNPRQVKRVSLRPDDVDALVFWTRWPAPLLSRLDELESLGLNRFLFLVTLLGYGRDLEPRQPRLASRIRAFQSLSRRIGPQRVVWRYDPILLSRATPPEWHVSMFTELARALRGSTERCVVSFLEEYTKIKTRMRSLVSQGYASDPLDLIRQNRLLQRLARIARNNGIQLQTCAQNITASDPAVTPGACVDGELLTRLFDLPAMPPRDPNQRRHCRCARSQDIGMYDSCTFGCAYCYATRSFTRSRLNRNEHDPHSPSLLGHHIPPPGQATLPGC